MEANKMEIETTNVEKMKNMVFEVMDKYTFLEEYLTQPDINTGRKMPTFIKIMSTILYLRQRLGFLVEKSEHFYNDIGRNNYTMFQNITEDYEIFNLLVCFVSMACGLVYDMINDDESKEQIITTLRQYYYKNKDFIATI